MGQYTIGVDVGGTKIAYGLFDGNQNLIAKKKVPSDPSLEAEPFFDALAESIQDMMREHHLSADQMRGIGIGMPSFILFEEGKILKTTNLTKIHDFPARAYLMKKLGGMRVLLDNDTHVAALAEHKRGRGAAFNTWSIAPSAPGSPAGLSSATSSSAAGMDGPGKPAIC